MSDTQGPWPYWLAGASEVSAWVVGEASVTGDYVGPCEPLGVATKRMESLNSAYRAGAEAMREAAAVVAEEQQTAKESHYGHSAGPHDACEKCIAAAIRSLPLPGQAARGTPT